MAVKEAKARTRDLEDALQRAKQDMARQLREYQVGACRRSQRLQPSLPCVQQARASLNEK